MEKEEYTTFPIGPLSYQRTVQAIKEALQAELSLFQQDMTYFQWEQYLRYGLAQFTCRFIDLAQGENLGDVDDYWKQVGLADVGPVSDRFGGYLRLPRGLSRVSLYSIRGVPHPHVLAQMKLPWLTPLGDETTMYWYWGVENGAALGNGIASWELAYGGAFGDNNVLRCLVGEAYNSHEVSVNVAKPADATTVHHVYQILCSKNLVTFLIDYAPVLFAVPCGVNASKIKENVLPYSVLLFQSFPSEVTPFMEVYTNRTRQAFVAPYDLDVPVSPYRFRFTPGHEVTPLTLPMYQEDTNTLLSSLTLAAGSVTSHPFPLFGFEKKTLFLRLNQISTVEIQAFMMTGNWRTYDGFTLAANTFKSYIMEGSPVLGRVVITPSAYPATIQEAEVSLA
jgi:hypothetical protein